LCEVLARFILAALQQPHQSPPGVGISQARPEFNGPSEVRFGPPQVSLRLPEGVAIKPGFVKARGELNRLIVIDERAIEITFLNGGIIPPWLIRYYLIC
jgi:hypothetical protein